MTPVVCTHRKSYLFVIHSYFSWCVTTACFSWHLGVSRTSRESDPQKVPVWRHTNSESLGNRCVWKFSEDIFSHTFYIFSFWSVYMYVQATNFIKLQPQSFNCDFSYSFLPSSSLGFTICWWMERLLTIWQSTLLHQKYTNLCWNFTDHLHDLLKKEKDFY